MKLSRRELAGKLAAGTALAIAARAQTPPAGNSAAKTAAEDLQSNSEALAKFKVPIFTEPAFQFHA